MTTITDAQIPKIPKIITGTGKHIPAGIMEQIQSAQENALADEIRQVNQEIEEERFHLDDLNNMLRRHITRHNELVTRRRELLAAAQARAMDASPRSGAGFDKLLDDVQVDQTAVAVAHNHLEPDLAPAARSLDPSTSQINQIDQDDQDDQDGERFDFQS